MQIPDFNDVLTAHERIRPWIHQTPVLTSQYFNDQSGAALFFKCENFQKVGAFKARGAANAVFGLPSGLLRAGVTTHSSGNHALGLAYAAGARGIPCHVVMPHTAPQAKKEAVIGYGGQITECESSMAAREAAVADLQVRTGADLVHPYNDPRVIAGQGTCARELIQQVPDLDVVIAPIGGGGLISGCCLTLAAMAPAVSIFAAEPLQADDAARSLQAGRLITDEARQTVADGLKMPMKPLTWHFVQRYVSDILTVDEPSIIDAMHLVWQRMKIIIEPSCAVPVAAILKNPDVFAGKRVGVIITGGNVDLPINKVYSCPD